MSRSCYVEVRNAMQKWKVLAASLVILKIFLFVFVYLYIRYNITHWLYRNAVLFKESIFY